MKKCEKCKTSLIENEGRKLRSQLLCDDCYIDEVMHEMPKAHYDNDAEFMNRLKDSYSIRKQQYH